MERDNLEQEERLFYYYFWNVCKHHRSCLDFLVLFYKPDIPRICILLVEIVMFDSEDQEMDSLLEVLAPPEHTEQDCDFSYTIFT